jgi:hypothetical protein
MGGSYWVIERQNMFVIYWKSTTEAIGISVESSGIMKMKYRQSSGRYQMNLHASASFRASTLEGPVICTWAPGASISRGDKEMAANSGKEITYQQSHLIFGDDAHRPLPFSPR